MAEKVHKLEIVICLGSSCFSRGNKKAVHAINAFIDEHMIRDKVHFHGAHCFGNCASGAILKIGDRVFEALEQEDVSELLAKELQHLVDVKKSD